MAREFARQGLCFRRRAATGTLGITHGELKHRPAARGVRGGLEHPQPRRASQGHMMPAVGARWGKGLLQTHGRSWCPTTPPLHHEGCKRLPLLQTPKKGVHFLAAAFFLPFFLGASAGAAFLPFFAIALKVA